MSVRMPRQHIACDLDGTLAHYDGWRGIEHIGDPVGPVLDRVRAARARGIPVSIFTARVARSADDAYGDGEQAAEYVRRWLVAHLGEELPVTAVKHGYFSEFWDDKAVRVKHNHGVAVLDGPAWFELGDRE